MKARLSILVRWYVLPVVLIGLGVLIGWLVFFNLLAGEPKVGVISFIGSRPVSINEDTAFSMGAMLDFAREDDSIKAVVIRLNSGGGTVADSEQLFLKIRQLREEKPVVVAVDGFAASGAYMMSLGVNYIFVKPGSLVGSVGVLIDSLAFDRTPISDERFVGTGPAKIRSTPGEIANLLEKFKEAFLQLVVAERGDKLAISPQEVVEARVYTGVEGVRFGLVDAIGDDTDAIRRAADLAGISNYGLVDVNVEVFRIFNEKLLRIIEPLLADADGRDEAQLTTGDLLGTKMRPLLMFLPSEDQDDVDVDDSGDTPNRPTDVNLPRFFYQYAPTAE